MSIETLGRLPRLHASTFRESWVVWSELVGVDIVQQALAQIN